MCKRLGQFARDALGDFAQRQERPRRYQPRQIGRQPAHRRRDRHVVVVQDDHQPVARRLRVVHRLIGHARRHRAVADHRNRLARLVRQLVGHRKAQRRRNRGRAVRRAERIIFALAPLGEARQPAAGAQRADAVAPPGQDLVRIALVADIPDQPVFGRVEHIMDRRGQFDHAQPAPRWPPVTDTAADRFGAQFVGKLAELRRFKLAEIGRDIDLVEQGRRRRISHAVQL
jgi:hypothetical protein